MKRLLLAAAVFFAPASLSAQVGHLPQQSPYRDTPYRQDLTVYSGWSTGAEGSAGVGAQAGPIAGIRYEIRIGGPAFFSVHGGYAMTERNVIDPRNPPATRQVGTKDVSLLLLDAGITLNLTGQKSWHGLVPFTRFGGGVVADVGGGADPGNFEIGTPFALVFGGGVRWATGSRWQLRFDVTDHLYRLTYPSSYTTASVGGETPVLAGKNGEWKNNGVFSLGVSYIISR